MAPPTRSRLQQKVTAASHYVSYGLGRWFPDSVPLLYLLGFPKSGTTWAAQMVGDYLDWPFPQHSLLPIGFQAVLHGHFLPSPKLRRIIYPTRDGRDVYASLYFHLARSIPEGDHPAMPRRWKKMFPGLVNKQNVRDNFPAFLEQQFRSPFGSRVHWAGHYAAFEQANASSPIPFMRYEDLLTDPEGVLTQTLGAFLGEEPDPDRIRRTVDKYRFNNQAGRKSGQEDRASFLRKGQAGDWVNHFTREAAEMFDRHCGDALIAAGYETDRSWIERCTDGSAPAPTEEPAPPSGVEAMSHG